MAITVSFNELVRPYFTPCYRAHMLRFSANLDLWDYDNVKDRWQDILDEVESENMPRVGCGEGIWDSITRNQFLADFTAWRDAGFPK